VIVCVLVQDKTGKIKAGDVVQAYTGWQTHPTVPASQCTKIDWDPSVAPYSYALGVLGMPGRTAFFGLFEAGKPQAGETVVVSGAAGAVGSIVVQLAKVKGCRVVAIAGDDDKLRVQ
jgi:NADPH-dependent curcumin reductase CurA